MSLSSLAMFAGIYALVVLMPGPGVAAVVARALTTGARRTAPFIWGMLIGDLVWFCFAVFGLAALAQTLHGLFVAAKYAGVAYLMFIAFKLWTAPPADPSAAAERQRGSGRRLVGAGLSMTLGNPKTMMFLPGDPAACARPERARRSGLRGTRGRHDGDPVGGHVELCAARLAGAAHDPRRAADADRQSGIGPGDGWRGRRSGHRLSSLAWPRPRLILLSSSKINAASDLKCKQAW